MSDIVWQALIGAVVTISLAYMQLRTRQSVDAAAEKAAKKVEEVKTKLETTTTDVSGKVKEVSDQLVTTTTAVSVKLDGIARTGDANHALLNGNMSVQLKIAALALRRVAELTKHDADVKAADLAEKAFDEHEERQWALPPKPDSEKENKP